MKLGLKFPTFIAVLAIGAGAGVGALIGSQEAWASEKKHTQEAAASSQGEEEKVGHGAAAEKADANNRPTQPVNNRLVLAPLAS